MEQEERAFVDLVEGLRRKPKMHCIIRSKTDLLDSFDDTLQETSIGVERTTKAPESIRKARASYEPLGRYTLGIPIP